MIRLKKERPDQFRRGIDHPAHGPPDLLVPITSVRKDFTPVQTRYIVGWGGLCGYLPLNCN